MKKLLGILVLGLFLITPSKADDISEFEIEGMSIGDSALDFFSEEQINNLVSRDLISFLSATGERQTLGACSRIGAP